MVNRGLLALVFVGLLLRVAYALAIYEPTLLSYHRGDYDLYRILAEEILRGDLTFKNSGYLMRPPLFPLLAAALGLQPLLIITVNILLATCIIPVTYLLAKQLDLSEKLSLLSALIVALDPTSVKYSGVLLAEPLANLLLALAFVTLAMLRRAESRASIVMLSGGGGINCSFRANASSRLSALASDGALGGACSSYIIGPAAGSSRVRVYPTGPARCWVLDAA